MKSKITVLVVVLLALATVAAFATGAKEEETVAAQPARTINVLL
jgi:hypothetical protein